MVYKASQCENSATSQTITASLLQPMVLLYPPAFFLFLESRDFLNHQ